MYLMEYSGILNHHFPGDVVLADPCTRDCWFASHWSEVATIYQRENSCGCWLCMSAVPCVDSCRVSINCCDSVVPFWVMCSYNHCTCRLCIQWSCVKYLDLLNLVHHTYVRQKQLPTGILVWWSVWYQPIEHSQPITCPCSSSLQ